MTAQHPVRFAAPRRAAAILFSLLFLALLPASANTARMAFNEIWAYLMAGEEQFLTPDMPISDIGYFGAEIGPTGDLIKVPKRERLAAYKGRVHLIVAEVSNRALTHFCLDPSLPIRKPLIRQILDAAKDFDGVQIDFEMLLAQDYVHYVSFIQELKAGLGEKVLSVALPARVSERSDYFGYERIAKIADRIIVMAYDEHWSGSTPGPVASLDWCARVTEYALSKIPAEKLVMGSPFYGRAWAEVSPSRAWKFSGIETLIEQKILEGSRRTNGIPNFEYTERVKVRVFYDDVLSLSARLEQYRASAVRHIAFWRLGQEDARLWPLLFVTDAVLSETPEAPQPDAPAVAVPVDVAAVPLPTPATTAP